MPRRHAGAKVRNEQLLVHIHAAPPAIQDDIGRRGDPLVSEVIAPCWCERRMVKVPQTTVREGRTLSCGKEECRGPGGDCHRGEVVSFTRGLHSPTSVPARKWKK